MINRKVSPAHLRVEVILQIIAMLTSSRLAAKRAGNTIEADVYKLVINALYGKLGDEFSFLKDHAALYNVTFNGQLYLLSLAEDFTSNDIKVISTNTDGIVCMFHKNKESTYYDICKKWEKRFNFTLEYTDYIKYVRTTVNDYMSIKPGNKIKLKGDFEYNIALEKGYNRPIVAYAIHQYFAEGIPLENTIKECKDIYLFCLSSKISSDFETVFTSIKNRIVKETILTKTTRFYVSSKQVKDSDGGYIFKRYKSKYNRKTISMCKHRKVTIFNNFFPVKDFSEYNVDYSYYIGEAYKMLYKISGQINNTHRVTSTKKRVSGTLFDELDMQEEINRNNPCKNCIFSHEENNDIVCHNEDNGKYLETVNQKCNAYIEETDDDDEENDDLFDNPQ